MRQGGRGYWEEKNGKNLQKFTFLKGEEGDIGAGEDFYGKAEYI